MTNSPEANQMWAQNPQYLLELDRDMDLFISLGQPDGRLVPGETYPFPDNIHHVMFCLFKLDDDEITNPQKPMKVFDRKKKPKMSVIKEYREISQRWDNVKKGKYILVPR